MNTISEKLGIRAKSIDYDFATYRQHHDTYFTNKQEELDIRYRNLQDVLKTLQSNEIQHWLQGKTMLGITKYRKLLENDSDEDVGTDILNIDVVCQKVIPQLKELGFDVIRATSNNSMVTVMRNHRYIDICFFREDGQGKYYYEQKSFPEIFYSSISHITVDDFVYPVPSRHAEICKYSYNLILKNT